MASSFQDIRSVVVGDVLSDPPKSPLAIIKAVESLLNVSEFDLTNELLKKFLNAAPKKAALLEVHQQMGSSFFVRLLRTPQISPLNAEVAELVMKAAQQQATSSSMLEHLVDLAISDDENDRVAALSRLRQAGAVSVPELLHRLRSEKLTDRQTRRLRYALAQLGPASVPALIGAVTSSDIATISEAVLALGHIGSDDALPYLLRPYLLGVLPPQENWQADVPQITNIQADAHRALVALAGSPPTRDQATQILTRHIRRSLSDLIAIPDSTWMAHDLADLAEVWIWNPQSGRVESRKMRAPDAAMLRAAVLADDLYRIAPDVPQHRELFLATQIGWAKLRHGIGKRFTQDEFAQLMRLTAASPAELNELLTLPMMQTHEPMAVGVIELLGKIGSTELLRGAGNQTPLSTALHSPSPRVRFVAADAILQLDPRQLYVGAANVAEILAQAIRTDGSRKALIVYPRRSEAELLAGHLRALGLETTIASSGRPAMRLARGQVDWELILVGDTMSKPSAKELIQQLAFDPLTKDTPTCLITRDGRHQLGFEFAQQFPLVAAFPMPYDASNTDLLLQAVPAKSRFSMTAAERLDHAQRALVWMNQLASKRHVYSFYDSVNWAPAAIEALYVPTLAKPAAELLGWIATPEAQTALVNFAGLPYPIEDRRMAVEALTQAFRQTGILLTTAQISQQYAAYNDSLGNQTASTVRSEILDAIEAPTAKARSGGKTPDAEKPLPVH